MLVGFAQGWGCGETTGLVQDLLGGLLLYWGNIPALVLLLHGGSISSLVLHHGNSPILILLLHHRSIPNST